MISKKIAFIVCSYWTIDWITGVILIPIIWISGENINKILIINKKQPITTRQKIIIENTKTILKNDSIVRIMITNPEKCIFA